MARRKELSPEDVKFTGSPDRVLEEAVWWIDSIREQALTALSRSIYREYIRPVCVSHDLKFRLTGRYEVCWFRGDEEIYPQYHWWRRGLEPLELLALAPVIEAAESLEGTLREAHDHFGEDLYLSFPKTYQA